MKVVISTPIKISVHYGCDVQSHEQVAKVKAEDENILNVEAIKVCDS